jgi:hypothetical protein
MEKAVEGGTIVLTEPGYHVAWPTIGGAYHAFSEVGAVALDGYKEPVRLFKLDFTSAEDLNRLTNEDLE